MFGKRKRKNPVVIDIDPKKTPITEEAVRSYLDSVFRSWGPRAASSLVAVESNILAVFPAPPVALLKALRLAEREVGHSLYWQEERPTPGATEPRLLVGIVQLLDGSYRATWQLNGSWMGDRELLITADEFAAFERWRSSRDSGPFGFSGAGRGPNPWSTRAER
ncbi:hypothetical protein [Rathayibacter rathayi]|uniref:hypothetical protein n=1 Tax=Rathayibacter rathayi TaxID=33887 RepID=UPI0011B02331|nr:hypothetical protein [Rathayibacter rathayi]